TVASLVPVSEASSAAEAVTASEGRLSRKSVTARSLGESRPALAVTRSRKLSPPPFVVFISVLTSSCSEYYSHCGPGHTSKDRLDEAPVRDYRRRRPRLRRRVAARRRRGGRPPPRSRGDRLRRLRRLRPARGPRQPARPAGAAADAGRLPDLARTRRAAGRRHRLRAHRRHVP